MKQIFIFLFSIVTSIAFAQTKEIAFKSHSGNMNNFSIALANDLFDSEASNFGLPKISPKTSNYFKTSFQLDSVIYVSKNKTIVVKKVYQRKFDEPIDSVKLMSVKRDILYNDPLFSKKHSLDSIKNVLIATGQYDKDLNKAVFIGYDNKKSKIKTPVINNSKPKENNIIPVVAIENNTPNSPFDVQLLQTLAGILLIAFITGWISWKWSMLKLQNA